MSLRWAALTITRSIGEHMGLPDGSREEYAEAAIRHYDDAHRLGASERFDNAGHLLGFAAECAIKHKIEITPSVDDNPGLHLPQILPAARKRLGSRAGFTGMYDVLKAEIFSDWSVHYRYSATGRYSREMFETWAAVTRRLFAAAGIKAQRN